jgi:Domain of unknown function DUF11
MAWPRLLSSLLFLAFASVALAADLGIHLSAAGTPFYEQPNEYAVDVTNHGPDAASAVVVTVTVGEPPLETSDSRCAQTAEGVRCELATLAASQTTQIRVRHIYRGNVGNGPRIVATVTSATADPSPANNEHVIFPVPVFPAAEVVTGIRFPNDFDDDGTLTIRYDIRNQHVEFPATLIARIAVPEAVEFVRANADCRAGAGQGVNVECTLPVPASTTFPLELTVRLRDTAGSVSTVLDVSWQGYPGVARHEQAFHAYLRTLLVTTSADSGEGSLRAILGEANTRCIDDVPCRIHFAIAEPVPAPGWFTIRPLTPLPAITGARITLDAATQTVFSGDTNPLGPEIFLDGSALAGSGNGFRIGPVTTAITGFAIGNFPENAIFGEPRGFSIIANYIGVDPTGARAAPNTRGIMLGSGFGSIASNVIGGHVRSGVFLWNVRTMQIADNRIGVAAASDDPIPNGASGVFIGSAPGGQFSDIDFVRNVIANNGHFGIAFPSRVWTTVAVNRIANNGLGGVDIDLDGPSPDLIPVPRITRAYWDGTGTVIEGTLPARVTGSVSETYSALLYANTQLEPGGYAEGERALGNVEGDALGRFTFRYSGDLRGLYVNGMTMGRTNFFAEFEQTRTSEFGQAVTVTAEP